MLLTDTRDIHWFGGKLCLGGTSRYTLSLCFQRGYLELAYSILVGGNSEPLLAPKVFCDLDHMGQSILTAFPHFDFDDALGFVAVGNIFGELCLYDLVGKPSSRLWPKSTLISDCGLSGSPLASVVSCYISIHHNIELLMSPQLPLRLGLPPLVPRPPTVFSTWYIPSIVKYCMVPDLVHMPLPYPWRTNWDHYEECSEWQGFAGDFSWLLEHLYGFLGDPKLIAHGYDRVLFRAGGLYFCLNTELGITLVVFDLEVTLADISQIYLHEMPTTHCRYAGRSMGTSYQQRCAYRNCWVQQTRPGGRTRSAGLDAFPDDDAVLSMLPDYPLPRSLTLYMSLDAK